MSGAIVLVTRDRVKGADEVNKLVTKEYMRGAERRGASVAARRMRRERARKETERGPSFGLLTRLSSVAKRVMFRTRARALGSASVAGGSFDMQVVSTTRKDHAVGALERGRTWRQ